MPGINCDPLNPDGRPDPEDLVMYGITWVRLVSRPGVEDYVEACQAEGLMVMAVVARESNGYVFGGPDLYQFGNEPDSNGPSSWTMTPAEYVNEFGFYQRTYPHLIWIGAGLASGATAWWSAAVSIQGPASLHMRGFSVHPYNKTAAQAKTLLAAYQRITPTLPLWVTEWHRPVEEIPAFSGMLRQTTVGHAFFCWSENMVADFGLSASGARILGSVA